MSLRIILPKCEYIFIRLPANENTVISDENKIKSNNTDDTFISALPDTEKHFTDHIIVMCELSL